ncbi:HD domain-containing protein [Deinococcus cellulosilyticus]|uniref:Phosphohydrolase n=1 Tax=Deinococcus cellulosilyticus (strain DSM 18568 / NBRC 106333 / KACC 11606 / 5516J-15) TaxID=1223518 RepID=A0A511N6H5_DEIC1|nr:HD domain-containing protein [Deinococcus cellulosilyticus]GEM48036.1 phosphohydrolase [Deinococcus cellulosilyticus NBRC 106333 = KACC 11606]
MLGKLKRLARSITPDQATPEDHWASRVLTPEEFSVYIQMDPRDREHGTRVARTLQADHPEADVELIAAAILHDCGKSIRPYSVVERVMVGLVPYRFSKYIQTEGVKVRFSHPELGAEMLTTAGARRNVAELVRLHHHPEANPRAALLYQYDHLE